MIEPIIRIALRYGAGALFGMEFGNALAGDPDVVIAVAAAVMLIVEFWYSYAKKKGWAT